ncbi:pantoate--beta-alanine ligase [Alphaproteobacteria bacterium]|nr:pantoate--beta-alanine ligase [Alphaproteobacteria bacterium]
MSQIEVFRSIQDMRQQVTQWKADGLRVGLVPTMGALHDGHLSLIDHIRTKVDRVIVSIFVNPTQFAAHEDLDTYPRQEAADLDHLQGHPADCVFAPKADQIYPQGFSTQINMQGPAQGLETDDRPHFFGGVAVIVAKLLLQSQTDVAIFGEKDFQQLLVIQRMVSDLDIPVEIIGAPIIREADGLAMSSRNAYLKAEQRQIAGQLNGILATLATSTLPIGQAEAQAHEALLAAGFSQVDYAALRDAHDLQAIGPHTTSRRALIAARLGDIRLIDNMSA